MGLSDDQLVNPGAVSDTLRCTICSEVYEDPVFSSGRPCQHVFCRTCLEKALQRQPRCPSCRAEVVPSRLQPHLVMRSLLDELHVHCGIGCGWTGRQDARPAHMLACPMKRLAEATAQLAERDHWLAERDAEIAALRARVRERDEAIAQRCAQIMQQEKQLEDYRGWLARLAGSSAQKDTQIAALHVMLAGTRRCAESEAAARLAEVQAETAAKAVEHARVASLAAARRAEVLREGAKQARRDAGLQDVEMLPWNRLPDKQPKKPCDLQIFVRELTGRTLTLKVEAEDTIDSVKLMIQDRTGIPGRCFYLTYAGKNLADARLVADYNISKDCTLTMLMRLYSMRLDSSSSRRCDQEPVAKRRRGRS
uniref:RING-type E3 ubiquitin transferase n=1 Tax=Alexandrium catenella TaxID=2925 RepID=A0A6T9QBD0_ALECA